MEGVEGLHEVSLGDGRLLAEHRRAEELAVALVGPVLLCQLEFRVTFGNNNSSSTKNILKCKKNHKISCKIKELWKITTLIQAELKRSSRVRRFLGSTVRRPRTSCLAAGLTYFHAPRSCWKVDESLNTRKYFRFIIYYKVT